MFLRFKKEVTELLSKALHESGFEFESDELALSESPYADLSSSISFKLSSKYKRNPIEICKILYDNININIPSNSYIAKVEKAKAYLNFYVSRLFLNQTLNQILLKKEEFGKLENKGKVIVEHTSANPDGPLHIGHIRNSVIGDTLARILQRAGYDVETQYYINDMGRQIAVVVYGLMNYELDTTKKPDHAISEIYVKANNFLVDEKEHSPEVDNLMKKYEAGEPDTVKKFKHAIDIALQGIKQTLEKMNIHHDSFIWESSFVWSGEVNEIIESIKQKRLAEIKDGALVVDLSKQGIQKPLVLQRSDGTTLYTTRDLAYHKWKAERCDKVIDILGADHKLISSQLKAVLRLLNIPEPEIVIFEFVSLPEGSMSTRKGVFISADEVLEQVEKSAYEEVNKRRPESDEEFKREVAKFVSIGAIRYDIVKVSPEKSTVFDLKQALDFEKQGAPYIQYAHARACSILKNAKNKGINFEKYDPNLLIEEYEINLIKKLSYFENVIYTSAKELKPNFMAIYARELADAFNQFYKHIPVLNAEHELRKARLALVECARIVLANTLDTLGIKAPESM